MAEGNEQFIISGELRDAIKHLILNAHHPSAPFVQVNGVLLALDRVEPTKPPR